jgi:hypothetical protein
MINLFFLRVAAEDHHPIKNPLCGCQIAPANLIWHPQTFHDNLRAIPVFKIVPNERLNERQWQKRRSNFCAMGCNFNDFAHPHPHPGGETTSELRFKLR